MKRKIAFAAAVIAGFTVLAVTACGGGTDRLTATSPGLAKQTNVCYRLTQNGVVTKTCMGTIYLPITAFRFFVNDVQSSNTYKAWAAANPADAAGWKTFRDALFGSSPKTAVPPQTEVTLFGQHLVSAGVLYQRSLG